MEKKHNVNVKNHFVIITNVNVFNQNLFAMINANVIVVIMIKNK